MIKYTIFGNHVNKTNLRPYMAGRILLVVTSGFDDMAFLANQVIIVENNNDVIIVSKENSTIKGHDSSAIAVSLEEALNQDVEYDGIIIVGGEELIGWQLLKDTINDFINNNKLTGAIGSGVDFLHSIEVSNELSKDGSIVEDGKVITMGKADNAEEFAEFITTKI